MGRGWDFKGQKVVHVEMAKPVFAGPSVTVGLGDFDPERPC